MPFGHRPRYATLVAVIAPLLAVMPLLPGCAARSPLSPPTQSPTAVSLREYLDHAQYRQAYGVYLSDQKIGWAIDELKPGRHQGREVAIQQFEIHATVNVGGQQSTSTDLTEVRYELDGEGRILFASDRMVEDGNEVVHTAERDGGEMKVIIRAGGEDTRRRVSLPRESLHQMRELERWLTGPPRPGARFENWVTAWDEDDINRKEVYVYRGRNRIVWGGVKTEVYLVSFTGEGLTVDCEVTSEGRILRGKVGGIFELRAEKESIAKDMSQTGSIDLLTASSIRIDKDLGDASRVESLRLEVSGLGTFRFPESHRQMVQSRGKDSAVLDLKQDFRSGKTARLSAKERQAYLQATPSIQAEHESIRKLAKEIVHGETDSVKVADRLQDWVHRNLHQTMAANAPTALDVLRQRKGDCTEHSLLFTALARASGLPTRQIGGVAFVNTGEPMFGWHEWAEIHDGRQWVSVDPMWNRVWVDATHIKFSEGTEDWAWINIVGRLKIRVLDFKTR